MAPTATSSFEGSFVFDVEFLDRMAQLDALFAPLELLQGPFDVPSEPEPPEPEEQVCSAGHPMHYIIFEACEASLDELLAAWNNYGTEHETEADVEKLDALVETMMDDIAFILWGDVDDDDEDGED